MLVEQVMILKAHSLWVNPVLEYFFVASLPILFKVQNFDLTIHTNDLSREDINEYTVFVGSLGFSMLDHMNQFIIVAEG